MKKITIISIIVGIIISILMMNVAWKHNSQGEIHNEGVINYFYWILIGVSWFIVVFIFMAIVKK